MQARNVLSAAAAAAGLLIAASASNAQLIVGVDDAVNNGEPNLFLIDVTTDTATALADTFEVWGAAADDPSGILYTNDGSTLQTSTYADIANPTTTTIQSSAGTALSMVGLAYGDGTLYGIRNIGGDGGATPEALYAIDPATGIATVLLDYAAADFDFGGIDYNPADGLLYATNDDASPARGLYSIDPATGAINFVVDYPGGEVDIDGTAVGDGVVYFVTDEPGDIYRYDIASGTFLSPLTNPVTGSELFSAGAWAPGLVPEPTSLALLGLGGLGLLRRRR